MIVDERVRAYIDAIMGGARPEVAPLVGVMYCNPLPWISFGELKTASAATRIAWNLLVAPLIDLEILETQVRYEGVLYPVNNRPLVYHNPNYS